MPPAQRKLLCCLSLASVAFLLAGCEASAEVHQVQRVSFADVDELFDAVDDELNCPEASSGHYVLPVPGREHEALPDRSCGRNIVMAHSEDPTAITDIQNMLAAHNSGPVPMVHNEHWFIVDITEMPEDAPKDLNRADSRELADLAETWGATYSTF